METYFTISVIVFFLSFFFVPRKFGWGNHLITAILMGLFFPILILIHIILGFYSVYNSMKNK